MRCADCGAVYSVVDDVPVLIPEGELGEQHLHQLDYFNAEFSEYDAYCLENWRLSYVERIFGALGVLDGRGPYLDVGVGGSGATVIEAARRGVEAVGCDLSVEGVLTARRFARDESVDDYADFVICAAEALPFPDASFAAVSAVAVLEHLEDDEPAVAEIARVVRPGGRIWLTVPHAFRHFAPPVWPFYWWHDKRIGHKRHYDERRLADVCTRAELELVHTRYSGHLVKILQYAATRVSKSMRQRDSPLWWRLEKIDQRAVGRRRGALQLNAVFRRPLT
jgi:ubiquinone/menaquinone biosynthesis C-methylase UbiE